MRLRWKTIRNTHSNGGHNLRALLDSQAITISSPISVDPKTFEGASLVARTISLTKRPPTPLRPPLEQSIYSGSYLYSKILPSLPLPEEWNDSHDRLICQLDAQDTALQTMVDMLKQCCPELASAPLTPGMVDKRLRTLDQNVDCPYWAEALAEMESLPKP
jgi:hypothetical protein